jgi:hypothetical protein
MHTIYYCITHYSLEYANAGYDIELNNQIIKFTEENKYILEPIFETLLLMIGYCIQNIALLTNIHRWELIL